MRETFHYGRRVRAGVYLTLLFAGVFVGTVLVQGQKNEAFAGIFSEYFLNQYASLTLDQRRLLKYVGSYRAGQYALTVGCGALAGAPALLGGLLFMLGMCWGTAISISTLQLGLRGVLLCAAGIFPQIFFYLPAFGWVLIWIWQGGSSRKKYLILAGFGFFFLFFGIMTEVYLNPSILQQLLRKM